MLIYRVKLVFLSQSAQSTGALCYLKLGQITIAQLYINVFNLISPIFYTFVAFASFVFDLELLLSKWVIQALPSTSKKKKKKKK